MHSVSGTLASMACGLAYAITNANKVRELV
jgi:hypothetical protein